MEMSSRENETSLCFACEAYEFEERAASSARYAWGNSLVFETFSNFQTPPAPCFSLVKNCRPSLLAVVCFRAGGESCAAIVMLRFVVALVSSPRASCLQNCSSSCLELDHPAD
jgi:hypothetical protein